jgi:hypothetical protein
VLDFFFKPLRQVLGAEAHEVSKPLEETEHEVLDAVEAIHRTNESIDRHVAVIEGLASSVGPLTESVNQLTATMADLVTILAPLAGAERDVSHVERLLHLGRHEREGAERTEPAGSPDPESRDT